MRSDGFSPLLPVTPWEALDKPVRETVILEGKTFLIDRPSNGDSLMKHPKVKEALNLDSCIPYWVDLWPGARMLGKVLLQDVPWWPTDQSPPDALEIGCGLGLPGIVALSLGLKVTFSDHDASSVRYACHNARLNQQTHFEALQMDWNDPPADRKWPLILAADLIYETRNVEPILHLITRILAPGGICLMTDQDRVPSGLLKTRMNEMGIPFTTRMVRAGEPGGHRVKGTLYRISLPGQTGGLTHQPPGVIA